MSFKIVNGKQIENLDVSYNENENKNRIRRPIIRRKYCKDDLNNIPSLLDKRKLVESFGLEIYNERDRYGQDIPLDFFEKNIGHNVPV